MKNRQEPENLLILTRTRTDRHGRRHSVAVPLIPPPDGEKFEGGYHVERNPITGGATLVPPEGNLPFFEEENVWRMDFGVCNQDLSFYQNKINKKRKNKKLETKINE